MKQDNWSWSEFLIQAITRGSDDIGKGACSA